MKVDVVIIGGGIAGLWTLARLREQAYSVVLVESGAIGGIQSIASQGIIHGGTKYALGGKLGDSAKAIGNMPAIWNDCLSGRGEINLSGVKINTRKQLMWSTQGAVSKIAGFFAGKMMQDRMQQLDRKDFPPPFDSQDFKGVVYELNEPVLDTASLMSELYSQYADYCLSANVSFEQGDPGIVICSQENRHDELRIEASQIVLAAGAGNADLLQKLQRNMPRMQKRPVHMTMIKGELPAIYAHCLGSGATPRVTITSTAVDGQSVWYIGGQLAEAGVKLDRQQQIDASKKELSQVLPWIDFEYMQWSTLLLDRAEIETPGHKRPESSFTEADDGVITVWPTKLAFAPKAASSVLNLLKQQGISPSGNDFELPDWPRPRLAKWPWEEAVWS